MQWSRADPAHVRAVANAIVALAFCACEAYGSRPSSQGTTPPIHRPFFLEAAISSRICALAKSSTMASILASMSTSRRCDSASLPPRSNCRRPSPRNTCTVCALRGMVIARRLPQLLVQLREPDKRWTNLRDNHEVYNAGRTADGRLGGGSLSSASSISCWPGLPRFCPVPVPNVAAIGRHSAP